MSGAAGEAARALAEFGRALRTSGFFVNTGGDMGNKCVKTFKTEECGYKGKETHCDRSIERCIELKGGEGAAGHPEAAGLRRCVPRDAGPSDCPDPGPKRRPERVEAWRTTDGALHGTQAQAAEHQAAVDFREWYEGHPVYGSEGSLGYRDLVEWAEQHADALRALGAVIPVVKTQA